MMIQAARDMHVMTKCKVDLFACTPLIEVPIIIEPAMLKVQATEHYNINNDDDWYSTYAPSGYGSGSIRLSDTDFYRPAVYHQFHCLDMLRRSIVHHNWSDVATEHRMERRVHQCLNMIRQAILCNSDTTLEPSYIYGVRDGRNESAASGLDVPHVCRDWTQVRSYVQSNYIQTHESH
ncbi:hypothetical protein BDZ94DRAFT_1258260 [Collybia nuda]|uniref:Uncharacterized protein n=1 Tax=Collybia nuda TaxID=64659 RepID=A0A9P5Y6N8_9AGAR|nr:hypothetical protein BDZ94DRAFT_1258260 [Collybia nuda]